MDAQVKNFVSKWKPTELYVDKFEAFYRTQDVEVDEPAKQY